MKIFPKFKRERFEDDRRVFAIELTQPWRKEGKGFVPAIGLGIGIGLGKTDIWVGWPREQESLCPEGCERKHDLPVKGDLPVQDSISA